MLVLRDVTITFRRYAGLLRQVEVPGVRGVSLRLAPGEVLALVGGSGAGKSLIAHAILGLLPRNARLRGTLEFDGQVLGQPYPPGLRGRRIAFLPQQASHLDPTARVGRQLAWAARRVGARADLGARLAALGLSQDTTRLYPHQLSGGMARRVLAAAAGAGQPDLLIADEPTVGLDPASAARLLDRLRAEAARGAAVLLISHDLPAILPLAHRVAVLAEGGMRAEERAADFAGQGDALSSAYARALWRALPQNGFDPDA